MKRLNKRKWLVLFLWAIFTTGITCLVLFLAPYTPMIILVPILIMSLFSSVFFSILVSSIQVGLIVGLYYAGIYTPFLESVPGQIVIIYSSATIMIVLPCIVAVFMSILKKTQIANTLLTNDLYAEKEHLRILLSSIMDSVIATDEQGLITYMNPEAEKITGWSFDKVKHRRNENVFKLIDQDNHLLDSPINQCLSTKESPLPLQSGLLVDQENNKFHIQYSISLLHNKDQQVIGAEVVFQNISQAKSLQDELYYNATHDSLTGLLNRQEFERILSQAVKDMQSKGIQYILCYLDLDFFKIVNDSAGHIAGDALLQEVATILQNGLGKMDIIARLVGDEFGILLFNSSLESGKNICQELIELVNAIRFRWNDKYYRIGMSIGMVLLSDVTRSANQMLRDADVACYAAKTEGRNQIFVFEDTQAKSLEYSQQISLVGSIQEAIENNRILFYVQKIASTTSNQSVRPYYEILIRLLGEDQAIIDASTFIAVAERFNLMGGIDRWVIRQILENHDEKLTKLDGTNFSINLSANSLNDPNFLPFVLPLLKQSALTPQRLCFEITETAAMSHVSRTIETVGELQKIGCKIALDDFGVGLSSFSYIKNFSVDVIKIDGSFVRNVVSKGVDKTIVQTINEMAHSLGMKTVAEYVENQDILAVMVELGVDYIQGYAIGVPEPLSTIIDIE